MQDALAEGKCKLWECLAADEPSEQAVAEVVLELAVTHSQTPAASSGYRQGLLAALACRPAPGEQGAWQDQQFLQLLRCGPGPQDAAPRSRLYPFRKLYGRASAGQPSCRAGRRWLTLWSRWSHPSAQS